VTRLNAFAVTLALAAVVSWPAHADGCSRSRDFLLGGWIELPQRPDLYRELYRDCLETLRFSNVQDAFVLEVGAIAVVTKRDDVSSTARTLAEFCDRFPQRTLHFLPRESRKKTASIASAVRMTASHPTSCQRIKTGS